MREEAQRLANTRNPADIIEALTGARPQPAPAASLSDYPLAFGNHDSQSDRFVRTAGDQVVSLMKKFNRIFVCALVTKWPTKSLVKLLRQLGVVNGAQIKFPRRARMRSSIAALKRQSKAA